MIMAAPRRSSSGEYSLFIFPVSRESGLMRRSAVRGLPERFQARFYRREIFAWLWRGVRSWLSPQPSSLAFRAFSVRRGRKPGNSAFLVNFATPEKAEPSQSRHRIPRFLRQPLACSGLGRSRSRPAGLSLVTRSQAGGIKTPAPQVYCGETDYVCCRENRNMKGKAMGASLPQTATSARRTGVLWRWLSVFRIDTPADAPPDPTTLSNPVIEGREIRKQAS